MTAKDTYYIKVWNDDIDDRFGIGECGLFRGLSCDDVPDYETVLDAVCAAIAGDGVMPDISEYPSITTGIESAMADWGEGGNHVLYPSAWTSGKTGIVINGLVWMGDKDKMLERVDEKLSDGFRCVKLKIGGIDFDDELRLLQYIRNRYSVSELELRLDANGAFSADDVMFKLDRLSRFDIHSIEQPVKPKQWDLMSYVCRNSPIPVALDEELIGIHGRERKMEMLHTISPSYIILKPTLCGGFSGADEWIEIARQSGIGWWATSALESNVGLNAIAQWVAVHDIDMPQGLGIGGLYINNIVSPLDLRGEMLFYNPIRQWEIPDSLRWKVF